MSFRQVSLRSPVPLPDWLPNFIILPSVLSVLAHTFLLVVFAVTLRSCERAPVGFSDEPTRAFGIVVTQPGDRVESAKTDDSTDSNDANSESSTDATTSVSQQSTPLVADAPPAELLLPKAESTPAIGSSVSFPNGESSANSSLSLKQGSGSDEKSNGKQGGPPGTVFMGIKDQGIKVIFVIDASGSMTTGNAMQIAKNALIASLQSLEERQKFLIIFYDDKPRAIRLKDETEPRLMSATEINKTLARNKIAGIQPGSGTEHHSALSQALRMNPDVVYFLTDALEPPLWPKELEELRIKNGGGKRARIHSIEFGQGAEIPSKNDQGNFLRRLARENGGTYRYHDVSKFSIR